MAWAVFVSALLLAGAAFAQQPGSSGGGNSGTPGVTSAVPNIAAPVEM